MDVVSQRGREHTIHLPRHQGSQIFTVRGQVSATANRLVFEFSCCFCILFADPSNEVMFLRSRHFSFLQRYAFQFGTSIGVTCNVMHNVTSYKTRFKPMRHERFG